MTDTAAEYVVDGLDFVTTVHRPQLPDVHLGFLDQLQAEQACWRLNAALTHTTHVDGTTISWSPRSEGVTVLPPVPTDAWALAELIKKEGPHEFPDLYSRLLAQIGDADSGQTWSAACAVVDRDAELTELRTRLERDLAEAIEKARNAARALNELTSDAVYDVDYAETDAGRDIGHFIDSARRNLSAAHSLIVR